MDSKPDEGSKAADQDNKVVADDMRACKLVYKREVDTLVSDRLASEDNRTEHELALGLVRVVLWVSAALMACRPLH